MWALVYSILALHYSYTFHSSNYMQFFMNMIYSEFVCIVHNAMWFNNNWQSCMLYPVGMKMTLRRKAKNRHPCKQYVVLAGIFFRFL